MRDHIPEAALEMIRNEPVDPATKTPALTAEEITQAYAYARERAKEKNAP
jgi:hypothetical protein